jgi:signal transduction histidine kinase/ActR/RegA family two-component response regulator
MSAIVAMLARAHRFTKNVGSLRLRSESRAKRWALAAAIIVAFTLLKVAMRSAFGVTTGYPLYPLATVANTWIGGFDIGAVTAVATAFAAKLLFEPGSSIHFVDRSECVRWITFMAQDLLMAAIVEALHRARSAASEARVAAEHLLAREQAARREAEEANRLKDEFLATMSHELRTPLTAILGWASIVRKSPSPSIVERAMSTIERNARTQARLIDDILDVSRIIRGRLRLEVGHVSVESLLREAVNAVAPAADAKGVRIDAPDATGAGDIVADPNRLQQVVWNLLSNAVKFTPPGGRVELSVQRDRERLTMCVRDTGEGIPAEFLPYVFERFRQFDGSTTRSHAGLGLGLAIVRHLVELHGGSVFATSDGPGRGATFLVRLPLRAHWPPEPLGPPPSLANSLASVPALASASLEGLRVVAVDDEQDARDLLGNLLRDAGADVRVAASADEGLRAVVDHAPHVLVSDIGMPDEDGYALLRRVRALPLAKGGSVPAVALTAYVRHDDVARAIAAGFARHVAKPVEARKLLEAVALLGHGLESGPSSEASRREAAAVR